MSGARAKKLRKEYRKEVQDYLMDGGMYEIFQMMIKPKPRGVPNFLWLWAMKFFVNIQEETDNAGKKTPDK